MHPAGADMIGIGMARWRRTSGEIIEATVSARYKFDEPRAVQKIRQVRRARATLSLSPDGLTVHGKYDTSITAMEPLSLALQEAAE